MRQCLEALNRAVGNSQTILIAEDNADDALLIKCQFKQTKVLNPIHLVSDGEMVVKYLEGIGPYRDRKEHPYPILLLLDLKMPRKGGFEVLEWQQNHPIHGSLPVIVLSVSDEIRELNKAYQLGARSFLTKPVLHSDLVNALNGVRGINFKLVKEGFCLERA